MTKLLLNKSSLQFILVALLFLNIGLTQSEIEEKINRNLGLGLLFNVSNANFGEYANPQGRLAFSIYWGNDNNPIGAYLDFGGGSLNFEDCENCYDFSVSYVEDVFGDVRKETNWTHSKSTLGLTYHLPRINSIFYSGFAIGRKHYGYRYYDSYHILGDNGRYWIDANKSEYFGSYAIGMIYITRFNYFGDENSKIAIQFGYESIPQSLVMGFTMHFTWKGDGLLEMYDIYKKN